MALPTWQSRARTVLGGESQTAEGFWIISSPDSLTIVLLVIALGIFGWLTARSRNFKSFQFQISLFIVIWIVGEVVDLLGEQGLVKVFSAGDIGIYVHVAAMGLFSAMLWIRFYLSQRAGKKMADILEEN